MRIALISFLQYLSRIKPEMSSGSVFVFVCNCICIRRSSEIPFCLSSEITF